MPLLKRDAFRNRRGTERIPPGDIAVVRVEGIEVMPTSRRTNVCDPGTFGRHGIAIGGKQVVSVKNLLEQSGPFPPPVREGLFVATGTGNPDWTAPPFRRPPRPRR